jgi:hypothetical protein
MTMRPLAETAAAAATMIVLPLESKIEMVSLEIPMIFLRIEYLHHGVSSVIQAFPVAELHRALTAPVQLPSKTT